MTYYLPLILVITANTVYHICSKSSPANLNVFAAITITYLVGATASFFIFLFTSKGMDFFSEIKNVNWATILLGLSIIGLEAGFIGMYKAGWTVSSAQFVASALVTILLAAIGFIFYKEAFTLTKLAGILICLAGLYLMK